LHLVVGYLPAQTGVLCLSSRMTLSHSLVLLQVLRTLGFTQLAFQCQGPDCYLSYRELGFGQEPIYMSIMEFVNVILCTLIESPDLKGTDHQCQNY